MPGRLHKLVVVVDGRRYNMTDKEILIQDLQSGVHFIRIFKDEKKNKSFIQSKPSQKAKKAELFYKHIASSDQYHLLEIYHIFQL